MNTYYQEYRNQHEHRKYPFTDDATMTSTGGQLLPVGFFVDAMLYPLDATGPFHISQVDTGSRTVTLQAAGTTYGIGTWEPGETTVKLYDTSGFQRQVGLLVLGEDAQNVRAETPMDFLYPATTVVPTCVLAMNQQGVRGFVTDDNRLATGTIRLEGRNGVEVKSYKDAQSRSVIRIDVYGCPPPANVDCDTQPDIRQIRIENTNCPKIIGSPGTDGVINITGAPGFVAQDLCPGRRLPVDGVLPAEKDICEDPAVPGAAFVCPSNTSYLVPVGAGRIYFVAPSTLAEDNPVKIVNAATPGEIPNTAGLDNMRNLDAVQRRVKHIWGMGVRDRGLITLKLKGR